MSDNWVVQNLENALETWNSKLAEIWTLITTSPQNFKGGGIWQVIVNINGAVQAMRVIWQAASGEGLQPTSRVIVSCVRPAGLPEEGGVHKEKVQAFGTL